MRHLALLLVFVVMLNAHPFTLRELWEYKTNGAVRGLSFSKSGTLGAAVWDHCAYIFDKHGNLINKICGHHKLMEYTSYCCGKFGFVNMDGYVYITDERGTLLKKIYVGTDYCASIVMRKETFLAGWRRVGLFDLQGNKLWDIDVEGIWYGPSSYENYWYIADKAGSRLIIVRDGVIINSISYPEYALDNDICGRYLVVSTWNHLYLYDLSNPESPEEIWVEGNINWPNEVSFSPDCRYIAVADFCDHELRIYSINGSLILKKNYGLNDDYRVVSVAWWRDRIAVGLWDGRVIVYKLEGYKPFSSEAYTTTTMVTTIKVPITIITTIEVPVTVTVTVPR